MCGYPVDQHLSFWGSRTFCKVAGLTELVLVIIVTPGRRQSRTLLTIDELGSKIARNSVFYCHLSPVGRQKAIDNSVFNEF